MPRNLLSSRMLVKLQDSRDLVRAVVDATSVSEVSQELYIVLVEFTLVMIQRNLGSCQLVQYSCQLCLMLCRCNCIDLGHHRCDKELHPTQKYLAHMMLIQLLST